MSPELYNWVLIPLLIFIARILDVSLGTIRVIFIAKGYKLIAPLLGFFEILIWLIAIRQVLENLTNIMSYFAFAGGFALGTYVGMVIEEKISIGKVLIRITTGKSPKQLAANLQKMGYAFTLNYGKGLDGKVTTLHSVINRHDIPKIAEIIKKTNPHAFYAIEDIRFAHETKHPLSPYKKKYKRHLKSSKK
ncbi:MAG: DUF2179 domain-containing protein [Candidatus Nanoarchaeia archaeon]|nr:DUF2179 domain-containing protein [Candidatus Nanoarchaeia archaeon]